LSFKRSLLIRALKIMAAPSLIGPPDDTGGTKSSSSGGVTVTVPLDLLSQDGVPPAQGDQVQAQIDATVKSVSGSNATLTIDAIDGQPVGQPDISDTGGPAPGSSAAMKAALMSGAGQNQMGIG
jgi:hypothetical protein